MTIVLREEIVADDINYLTSYIDRHYSYDFSKYSISSFKRRLNRIMDKFNFVTIEQLVEHFQQDKTFIKIFLHEITVHVTEMFRDPEFWAYSRENCLKNLFKQSKTEKVNFWLAGCAGGEEVFSLAILLKEKGWYERVNIIATDIDELIFENALSGKISLKQLQTTYHDNYIKAGGTKQLSDYYTIRNNTATMNMSLLKNVTFQKHDLVKEKPLDNFGCRFLQKCHDLFYSTTTKPGISFIDGKP